MRIPFTKMVGTGNDFIIVDTRRGRRASAGLSDRGRPQHQFTPSIEGVNWRAAARQWCDRHEGIGADGVLVLEPSASADAKMRVFNPDGSEAEMCGNGARCAALYLTQVKSGKWKVERKNQVRIQTKAGALTATVRRDRVAMRMTDPTDLRLDVSLEADRRRIRAGFINTGVPHLVVPVAGLDAVDVLRVGRALRYHKAFSPRGTNVNFVQPDGRKPNRLRVRTYERGVEEETLACGTGLAAAAIVHGLTQNARSGNGSGRYQIEVQPKSGDHLSVSFVAANQRVTEVVLTGAARRVFDGVAKWPLRRD